MKSNKSKNKPFLLKGHLSSSSNLVLLLRVPGGGSKKCQSLDIESIHKTKEKKLKRTQASTGQILVTNSKHRSTTQKSIPKTNFMDSRALVIGINPSHHSSSLIRSIKNTRLYK